MTVRFFARTSVVVCGLFTVSIILFETAGTTAWADSCQGTFSNNADTVTCQADANADNTPLVLGDGDDVIAIISGTFASGIDAEGDNDTYTMSGGTIGYLNGGSGEDIFNLNGGTINGVALLAILAGDDADTITLDGTDIIGTARGEDGNDIFYLLSGSATSIEGDDNFGATGQDLIILNGANIGAISGQGDIDTINLLSGTADLVQGGQGNDRITLDGATIGVDAGFGIIGGDEGNDTIDLLSGTVIQLGGIGGVSGGGGDDVITLDGATIDGNIFGNADDDRVHLRSGTVAVVDGGDGSDDIYVYDTFGLAVVTTLSGGDDAGSGDGFFDTLHLIGQTVATADIPVFENFERVNLENSTEITVSEPNFTYTTETFDIDGTSSLLLTNGGGAGVFSVTGQLINNGLVDLADGFTGDTFAVGSDFLGRGTFALDVALDASALADTVTIGGGTLGSTARVHVNDVGSGVGSTTPIPIIFVSGATAPGDFALDSGVVTAGLLDYSLILSGTTWQLEAEDTVSISVDPLLPDALLAFGGALIGNYHERNGFEPSTSMGANQDAVNRYWMRGYGALAESDGSVLGQSAHSETEYGFFQGGIAGVFEETGSGDTTASLFAHYGASNSDTFGAIGQTGTLDFSGYGVGGSLTWLGHGGGYVDAVAVVSGYSIDTASVRGPVGSTDAVSFGGSLEAGKRFDIGDEMFAIPQVQLVYQTFQIDDYTNTGGMAAAFDDPDSLMLRTGVAFAMTRLAANDGTLELRGELNLLAELLDDTGAMLNGTSVIFEQDSVAGEIGVGATFLAPGSRYKIWADADYSVPFGDGLQELSGIAGVKINW